MAITEKGNYGIAEGSKSDVLQDLIDQGVSKTQILGFHHVDSTTVAILYAD